MAVTPTHRPATGPGCYLCGDTAFDYRSGVVRDKPELKVCECRECGLVYLSSFVHARKDFYEDSGMHGSRPVDVDAWLSDTESDDIRRYNFLKERLPGRRVLDFGCGAGGFLMRAGQKTTTAYGVELEKRLRPHFSNHGLTVYSSLDCLDGEGLAADGFDFITLFHVLEHVPDPRCMLRRLADLLADDGEMFIEVPNADDALLSLYECEAFSSFTYWSCHLFLFTSRTLSLLAEQVGLRVNYVRQVQRYPLSNHLYWLAKGMPGGQKIWAFLDSPLAQSSYEKELAAMGKCDTLLMSVSA